MDSLIKDKFDDGIKAYNNENFNKAYLIFLDLAEKNMLEAQMQIGYMLYEGVGTKKDLLKALFWFRKSVNINNTEALRMIGWCHLEIGNFNDGVTYLEQAITEGNIDAIIDIGSFYDFGDYSFPINKEKALEYYSRACSLENKEGCRYMGLLLQELNIRLVPYIKEHIGLIKFLNIMLYGNILKFIGFVLSGKCFRAKGQLPH